MSWFRINTKIISKTTVAGVGGVGGGQFYNITVHIKQFFWDIRATGQITKLDSDANSDYIKSTAPHK